MQNRRKGNRIEIENPVSYELFDAKNMPVGQGMGRIINVSRDGVLIETYEQVDAPYIIFIANGLDDDVYQVRGKVMYTQKTEQGWFQSGIKLLETPEKKRRLIVNLIRYHTYQKNIQHDGPLTS